MFAQLALKRAALRVGTVEHRYLIVRKLHPLDLAHYPFRFRSVVHIWLQEKELSFLFLGIDLLEDLVFVLVNKRIGGIDDILRRAVVTLQLKEMSAAVGLLESKDITDVRSSEGIDRLCVIAHHGDVILRRRQLLYQEVLHIIGVLVLIHEDIPKRLLVFIAHLGEELHQSQHLQQDIIKIHRIACFQAQLIEAIDIV